MHIASSAGLQCSSLKELETSQTAAVLEEDPAAAALSEKLAQQAEARVFDVNQLDTDTLQHEQSRTKIVAFVNDAASPITDTLTGTLRMSPNLL